MLRTYVRKFNTIRNYNKQWAVSEDGVVKFESLTKESLDGALKVMRETYFKTENVCKVVGVPDEPGAIEELIQTCYDAAKDGVSIVANDTRTNEIVGVWFNKIQVPVPKGETYYEKFGKKCKYKSSKAYIDFAIDFDNRVDLFKLYNVNCLLEFMCTATMPNFQQKKIAKLLLLSSLKLGQQLYNGHNVKTPVDIEGRLTNADAVPSLISAVGTSNYTQKLCVLFGFDHVLSVNYEDYTFDGRKFSDRIGSEHKTYELFAKRLSQNVLF